MLGAGKKEFGGWRYTPVMEGSISEGLCRVTETELRAEVTEATRRHEGRHEEHCSRHLGKNKAQARNNPGELEELAENDRRL